MQDVCRQAFDEWAGLFRDSFRAAGTAEERASVLAVPVEAVLEGLLLIARAYRDASAMRRVADELAAIVAAAVPDRPRMDREE